MIAALVVRKFRGTPDGQPPTEAACVVDLPVAPARGDVLAFDDGGEAGVSAVRLRATSTSWKTGMIPVALEVRTGCEDRERLGPALACGWKKLEAPA